MPWNKTTTSSDRDYLLKRMFREHASLEEADRSLKALKWLSHPENTPYHQISLNRINNSPNSDTVWLQAISQNDNYDDIFQVIDKTNGTPKRTADILENIIDKIENSCINCDDSFLSKVEAEENFLRNILKQLRKED